MHVTIVLATCNGARFLEDQLHSLVLQTHTDWSLWITDDGSTDHTQDIVAQFQAANPERDICFHQGPGRGSTQNFLSAIHHPDFPQTAIAFCDQDDVWMPEKLQRAIAALSKNRKAGPKLYGSSSLVVTDTLEGPVCSPIMGRPPHFGNALVQNIMGGNTMVLNFESVVLLQAGPEVLDMSHHDWWAYQLVSGAGGQVIYDPEPSLYYRQHADNQIGANWRMENKLQKIRFVLSGNYKRNVRRNLGCLKAVRPLLTPENQIIMDRFEQLCTRGASAAAVFDCLKLGVHRQSRAGNLMMYFALLLGKV